MFAIILLGDVLGSANCSNRDCVLFFHSLDKMHTRSFQQNYIVGLVVDLRLNAHIFTDTKSSIRVSNLSAGWMYPIEFTFRVFLIQIRIKPSQI